MAAIGKIRENVGLLVFVIAAAIVAFLFMDAMSIGGQSQLDPNVLGNIDGETLMRTDYESRIQQQEDQYNRAGFPIDDKTRFDIREQVWQQYLQEKLSSKAYANVGITIPNAEFKEVLLAHQGIVNEAIFQGEDGQFDKAKFDEYIAGMNIEEGDPGYQQAIAQKRQFKNFEQNVYRDHLKAKYDALLSKAVYVPSWLAKQNYAEKNAKATVRFVQVPYSNIDPSEITVTDSELLAYMQARPNEYLQKAETRDIDFVVFPISPSEKDTAETEQYIIDRLDAFKTTEDPKSFLGLNYSETPFNPTYFSKDNLTAKAEIKDSLFTVAEGTVIGPYYDAGTYKAVKLIDKKMIADSAKIRTIVKQASATVSFPRAKEVIDSIKTVLDNGGDFEALASAFSDDASKETGGEIADYIKPGAFRGLPELDNAIFYEYSEGDVFSVQTAQGWHLIEILDANTNTEAVQTAMLTRNIDASKTTRDEAYSKANSFVASNRTLEEMTAAAEEAGVTVQSANGIDKNSYDIVGLGISQEVATWAFQAEPNEVVDKVLQVDQNLPTGRTLERYVVTALKGINPEGLQPLELVRSRVEAAVKKEKQAAKIIEQIGGTTGLDAIASQMNATVSSASDIDFESPSPAELGPEPKVQAAIFALPPNTVSKAIQGDRGIYFVEVNSISEAGDPADLDATKKSQATSIANKVSALFSNLVQKATIEDLRSTTRTY